MIDRRVARHPLPWLVEEVVRAGVDWIQIRERELEAGELFDWSRDLIAAARRGAQRAGRESLVLINRRIDLALALEADGVHLGFDAMAVGDARALLGSTARIGVSTHRPEEVADAARAGASYVHLAPIFAPLSKRSSAPALGLDTLRLACETGLPVLAQGGIEVSHCAAVLAHGAAGVAVTGAILMADDPVGQANALRHALDDAG